MTAIKELMNWIDEGIFFIKEEGIEKENKELAKTVIITLKQTKSKLIELAKKELKEMPLVEGNKKRMEIDYEIVGIKYKKDLEELVK